MGALWTLLQPLYWTAARLSGSPPPPQWRQQDMPGACGHTVLAMLLNEPVERIMQRTGRRLGISVAQAAQVLSDYGYPCRPIAGPHVSRHWSVYRRRSGGLFRRGIAFLPAAPGARWGHALLIYGPVAYDPGIDRFFAIRPRLISQWSWVLFMTTPDQ